MKNKVKTGLVMVLFGLLFTYIFIMADKKFGDPLQTVDTLDNTQSTDLLATMENEMATNTSDDSQPSSKDQPDYTNLYPNLYTVYLEPKKMQEGKKIAYLTFDDGPSENTFKILDILADYNVKATFFIVGHSITITDDAEECLNRMVNEGHTIGLHSDSHDCKKIYRSMDTLLEDYDSLYQKLYDITGVRANVFRLPLGSLNGYCKRYKDSLIEEMSRRGFSCFDWNVSANDSVGKPSAYSIRHNIEKDLVKQDYPIILMHDSMHMNLTVKTLPSIIEMIKAKGYEFDTLDHREPYQFPWDKYKKRK